MSDRNKKNKSGPAFAGQSGDIQQLADVADADSESVEELVEEGNAFEAGVGEGVGGQVARALSGEDARSIRG
jgi:hypothetical protein